MTMHYNKIVKLVWFRVVNKNNKLFKQNHKFHSGQSRHRNTIYLLLWVWKLLMKNAFLWSLMSFIWLGSWTMISPKMVDKTHQSQHDWIYLARADLDHRFQKHTISSETLALDRERHCEGNFLTHQKQHNVSTMGSRSQSALLILYTLTLVCTFSILFSLHFLRCCLGEFA